jgi:hypothetical protein
MRWAAILLGISSLMSGGCATVLRGTHQTIHLRTDPPGATCLVDGNTYTTPANLDLRRKEAHFITIAKDGYRTIEFNLSPEWDGVSLVGAILIPGGSLGLVTDRVSGADMNFYTLAEIKMVPSTRPSEPSVVLMDFKGRLLTDEEYQQALVYDRIDRAQFFRGEP